MLRTRVLLVYIDTECSVLPSPARHYLTIPGLVRSCQALSDSFWPCLSCLALLGPVRPCLAPSGLAWRCPAQPCPVLQTLPCPYLSDPVRHCPALSDIALPSQFIAAHFCPIAHPCLTLFSSARPDPVRLHPARPWSAPPGQALVGTVRPCPACLNDFNCHFLVDNALSEVKLYSSGQ